MRLQSSWKAPWLRNRGEEELQRLALHKTLLRQVVDHQVREVRLPVSGQIDVNSGK